MVLISFFLDVSIGKKVELGWIFHKTLGVPTERFGPILHIEGWFTLIKDTLNGLRPSHIAAATKGQYHRIIPALTLNFGFR